MLAPPVFFAFGAMVCWAFGDFFIQRTTRKIGSIESLFWIGLIGSIGLFPFVIADLPAIFSIQNAPFLLFLGAWTFLVAIVNFEALRIGKLSVVDVILEIELPITIVLALVFFGESLTVLHLGLMLLIFAGVLLISIEKLSLKHVRSSVEKGVHLAVLAAIGMGLLNFFTAMGARSVSPLAAIWLPAVVFTVLSLLALWHTGEENKIVSHAKAFPALILAQGIFDTLAWTFFALALSTGVVSITTAITEAYPALAMLLALTFNREKIALHQMAGALLAIIASVYLGFYA